MSMSTPTMNDVQPPLDLKPISMDPATIFDNFDRRIHRLEQIVTGSLASQLSAVVDGNFPGGITVGGVPIDAIPPNSVTDVVAIPGAFFENIFVDVTWNEALTGPNSLSFDVELAERSAGPFYSILNVFNTAATNIRINNLDPNKDYGVRILPVSAIGIRGVPTAWVDFTTVADSTIPPAPSGVVIARGATTVVVKFTGLTEAQAPDVAWGHGNYEIQIDTTVDFSSGNFRSMISSATVVAFSDIIGELPAWYARVRAIDSSGNASAWSTVAGPSGPAGGVNDSMIIADLSAAKIQFGTMSGDRIAVNTLSAGTIKTSSLTSANITLAGGSFRAGNPVPGVSPGVLINSQGIRLYSPSGSLMVSLDAASGNAAFTGAISGGTITGTSISGGTIIGAIFKTNSAGERLEITGLPAGKILYQSGDASQSNSGQIYFDIAGSGGSRVGEVTIFPHTYAVGAVGSYLALRSISADATTKAPVAQLSAGNPYPSGDGSWVSMAGGGQGAQFMSGGNMQIQTNKGITMTANETLYVSAGGNVSLISSDVMTIQATTSLRLACSGEIVFHNNARVDAFFRAEEYYGVNGTGDGVLLKDNNSNDIEFEWDGSTLYIYVNGTGYPVYP